MPARIVKLLRQLRAVHIVCIVLLLLLLVVLIVMSALRGILLDQKSAESYRGSSKERYAQISYFLPAGEGAGVTQIESFRREIDAKIESASLTAPENASLWIDAYSGTATVSVIGSKGSASMSAIGIGGDFFKIHPLKLESGSYISGSDFSRDRVVLDEEAAWSLFGAVDVAGMTVYVDGSPFIVAGVVERESNFASKKAYGDRGAGIYLLQEALPLAEITCYELVMVNPIKGFAEGLVKDKLKLGDGYYVVNSERYNSSNVWKVLTGVQQRAMIVGGFDLPYWENAARIIETYLAILMFLALLLPVFPLAWLVYRVAKLWSKLDKKMRRAHIMRRTGGHAHFD